jgi:hypothetical protein
VTVTIGVAVSVVAITPLPEDQAAP